MSDDNLTVVSGTAAPLPPSPIPDLDLLGELGRGGMGVVYKARQTFLDRIVALKLLLVPSDQREFTARFQREAKLLASLHHPHIVACYQAGLTAANHPYLVMEFIDGPDLRRHLERQGPLPWREAVLLVRDVAAALSHAHDQGIIHRDVKPENILLAPRPGEDGFPYTAKLADLGLARPVGGDLTLTRQGTVMGSPATMAPEQFDQPDAVDFRADIYGLGCVLHQAVTGAPAFTGATIAQLVTAKLHEAPPDPRRSVQGLPEGVARLVTWMLARRRDDRPASYADLIAACDKVLGGRPLGRRGNRSAWLAVSAALVACGLGAYLALRPVPDAAPAPVTTPAPVPAPAPVPSAPAPAPKALTDLAWGTAVPLWPTTLGQRLEGWTAGAGAQWTAAEARPNAVAGFGGHLERPLPSVPGRLSATLHLFNTADLVTDRIGLGVALADGRRVLLEVQHLNRLIASVTLAEATANAVPRIVKGPHPLTESLNLPVVVAVDGHSLLATVAGFTFERVTLPAAPVAVLLTVSGDGPGEISDLTFQPATP